MFSISRLNDSACMSHSPISALLATEDFFYSSSFFSLLWAPVKNRRITFGDPKPQHYVCHNLAGTFSNKAKVENLFLRFDINKCFFFLSNLWSGSMPSLEIYLRKREEYYLAIGFLKMAKLLATRKVEWIPLIIFHINSFLSNIWKRDILKKLIT